MKTKISSDSPITINSSGGIFTQIPGEGPVAINHKKASTTVPDGAWVDGAGGYWVDGSGGYWIT
jgi:hypothetical protein